MSDAPDSPDATPAPPAPLVPAKKASLIVILLMVLDIILGLGIAYAGHVLLEDKMIALLGGVLATIGAIVLLAFLVWGNRPAKK